MKQVLLIFIILIVFLGCNLSNKSRHATQQQDTIFVTKKIAAYSMQDSIALLQLTKSLYQWTQTNNNDSYFSPLQNEETDTVYAGLDIKLHKQKLGEMRQSGLFSEAFITNYNRIALTIDAKMKEGALQWKAGELPPFGNGANPWCNCQDVPDDFLTKIWIMHLTAEKNGIFYNLARGNGGTPYNIAAVKENNRWKIQYMEGFDYDDFVDTFKHTNNFTGEWQNEMVKLNIGDTSLAFVYHGQCVYFYPVKKISDTEFEMIWARDMDCKFDNGTGKTFGLKEVPQQGKPFAKFILKNDVLYAQYYYKEWVEKYTAQVQDNVFTSKYFREEEEEED